MLRMRRKASPGEDPIVSESRRADVRRQREGDIVPGGRLGLLALVLVGLLMFGGAYKVGVSIGKSKGRARAAAAPPPAQRPPAPPPSPPAAQPQPAQPRSQARASPAAVTNLGLLNLPNPDRPPSRVPLNEPPRALCRTRDPHAEREDCEYKPSVASPQELHGLSPYRGDPSGPRGYACTLKWLTILDDDRAMLLKETVHENALRAMGMRHDSATYRDLYSGTSRAIAVGGFEYKPDEGAVHADIHGDSASELSPAVLVTTHALLKGALPEGVKLRWDLPEGTAEKLGPKLPEDMQASLLRADERFARVGRQAVVPGVAYGRLVDLGERGEDGVRPTHVVVSRDSVEDLPPCAGLVAGTYQSALSHASILSRERGTPMGAVRGVDNEDWYQNCMGKLVRLEVKVDANPNMMISVQCFCDDDDHDDDRRERDRRRRGRYRGSEEEDYEDFQHGDDAFELENDPWEEMSSRTGSDHSGCIDNRFRDSYAREVFHASAYGFMRHKLREHQEQPQVQSIRDVRKGGGAVLEDQRPVGLVGLDEEAAADPAVAGSKAARLALAASVLRGGVACASALPGSVVPVAALDQLVASSPAAASAVSAAEGACGRGGCRQEAKEAHEAVAKLGVGPAALRLGEAVAEAARERWGNPERVIVRSSSPSEDLKGGSAAGVYKSLPAPAADPAAIAAAVAEVWASPWLPRAVEDARQHGRGAEPRRMAVLVQPMLSEDGQRLVTAVALSEGGAGGRYRVHADVGHDRVTAGRGSPEEHVLEQEGGEAFGGILTSQSSAEQQAAEAESRGYEPLLDAETLRGCIGPTLAALQGDGSLGCEGGVDAEFAVTYNEGAPEVGHQVVHLLQVRPGHT